ncbi:hypothetical protein [Flavobacterium sp.]|uniref:hypothetical protein n=1 Tax=Flavobacterium sp. TaxID=239 RepID=UPI003D6B2C7D
MKSRKLIFNHLFLVLFFLGPTTILIGQNTENTSLYNWFDNKTNKENLPISNGTLHANYDRTINNENRYYYSDKFSKGSVTYNDQNYYDLSLKYDIYKDAIVLNLNKDSDNVGINLIKEKTTGFTLCGRKFVNLSIGNKLPSDYYPGFYEENVVGKGFIFYIKYRKEAKEIVETKFVSIDYIVKNEFVLYYKNAFVKINSKRDLTQLFPDYKNKIDDFYVMNRTMETANEVQFMENLMRHINSFLLTESK